MDIQRFAIGLDARIYPNEYGHLCYFKSHQAIVLEKQTRINTLEHRVEDLENEIRNLRTSKSCTCSSGK